MIAGNWRSLTWMLLPKMTALKYWLDSQEMNTPIRMKGSSARIAIRSPMSRNSQTMALMTSMNVK